MVRRGAATIVSGLTEVADGVQAGTVTVPMAADKARVIIAAVAGTSAKLGAEVAGLFDWTLNQSQLDELMTMVEVDVAYFRRFMESIEAMGRDVRLGMYGGGSDEAFFRGFASSMPSSAVINWRLGITERHCPDCIELAKNSPYSPTGRGGNPLPTVPRGGDTQCLSNCLCSLDVTQPFRAGPAPEIRVEVTALGSVKIDPNSAAGLAAGMLYQELVERYAYYLRLSVLAPKTYPEAIAKELLNEITSFAKRQGHSVRLGATDDEITAPVQLALASGLKWVEKPTDDLILLVATILTINDVVHRKITATRAGPAAVRLDDGKWYPLDQTGRNILFVEA